MPTLISTATSAVSPAIAATCSAAANAARRASYAMGTAAVVAIVGGEASLDAGDAFEDGWIFVTALMVVHALIALVIQKRDGARLRACERE